MISCKLGAEVIVSCLENCDRLMSKWNRIVFPCISCRTPQYTVHTCATLIHVKYSACVPVYVRVCVCALTCTVVFMCLIPWEKIEFFHELFLLNFPQQQIGSFSAFLGQRNKRHNDLFCFYFHKLSWHRSDPATAIHWEGPAPKDLLLLWEHKIKFMMQAGVFFHLLRSDDKRCKIQRLATKIFRGK